MQPWKKTGIRQKWLQPTQFGDTILVISFKVVNPNLKDWRKLWKKNQNEKKWSIEGAWPIRRNMLLWILSLLDAAFQQSLENTSGNYVGILWEYLGGFLWGFLWGFLLEFIWGFFWRFLWGILCEYSPLLTLPNNPSQLINVSLLCNQNWPRRGWKYLFPNIPNCHNCR